MLGFFCATAHPRAPATRCGVMWRSSCGAAANRPRGTLSSISGKKLMVRIEDIARAALAYEALIVRELIQDLLRDPPDWASIPRPAAVDENTLVVAAALLELLALRAGAEPAAWA